MRYKKLGKTNIDVSILGYGILRMPKTKAGRTSIDTKESIRIIRHAIDNGINFIDTAYNYEGKKSETIVGKALLDGYREKITLMTKSPTWLIKKPEDFDKYLNEQLEKLQTDTIDIYLMHNLSEKRFENVFLKYNLIERMEKARKDGKIRYMGFSSHDTPENIKKYLDTFDFDVVLVQYNFLDQSNVEVIQYAAEKGLGVAIMGPVGGGRLAMQPTTDMKKLLTKGRDDFVDLAFKLVWSNPNISIVLSGMSSEEMIDENIHFATKKEYTLSESESKRVAEVSKVFQEIYDLNCTQCGYCMPCPSDVNIKEILKQLMVSKNPLYLHPARRKYYGIGISKSIPGKKATACTECGECEEKCPQNIPIINRIKEAHRILSQ